MSEACIILQIRPDCPVIYIYIYICNKSAAFLQESGQLHVMLALTFLLPFLIKR